MAYKNPLELSNAIQKRPNLKSLEDNYKKYLTDYTTDIDNIGWSDRNGYPREDAIFDQILLRDFNQHAKDNGYDEDWNTFNDLVSEDDEEAVGIWNRIGDLTKEKVKALLGGK